MIYDDYFLTLYELPLVENLCDSHIIHIVCLFSFILRAEQKEYAKYNS